MPHVRLGQQADLVLVAPATADLLARAATGRADDLLTNVLLTARCPVVSRRPCTPRCGSTRPPGPTSPRCAPAARSSWTPTSGRLTGADSGPGRLPEPAELFAVAATMLADPGAGGARRRRDLAGLRVVVSAGGTREHLDPVRFLGNASSGLMGWALARAAVLRGAEVQLVAANVEPAGARRASRSSRSPPPPSSRRPCAAPPRRPTWW